MPSTFDRDAARSRHAASTPGRWIAVEDHVVQIGFDSAGNPEIHEDIAHTSNADAEFIANAHDDLPAALDLLEEAEQKLRKAERELSDANLRIEDLEDRVSELIQYEDKVS